MGNTKDTGDETEAKVMQELIASGYSVAVPFGDNDKYDLIVDAESEFYRIQCKTAWQNKESTILFNTHSQTTDGGDYHEESYHNMIDAFVVRNPDTDSLYWIDIADAPEQKMELRFEASIDHPSINWAAEYEFTGDIP